MSDYPQEILIPCCGMLEEAWGTGIQHGEFINAFDIRDVWDARETYGAYIQTDASDYSIAYCPFCGNRIKYE